MNRASVAYVGVLLLLAGCASNRIDVLESGARPDLRVRGLALTPDDGAGRQCERATAGPPGTRISPVGSVSCLRNRMRRPPPYPGPMLVRTSNSSGKKVSSSASRSV